MKRVVTVVTLALFVVTFSMQNIALASDVHGATAAQLHQAVQTSHARVLQARQAMDNLLGRPVVQAQLRHAGVSPDKVRARVAMLSDSELLKLHTQVMAPGLQQKSAGLTRGAIIAIVFAGVAGVVILSIVLTEAINDAYGY